MGIRRSEATLWNRYENCILKCLSVGFCFAPVVVAVVIVVQLVMMAMVYRNLWITRWSAVPKMEITLAVIILETRFRCHRNNVFFLSIASAGKWDCNLCVFFIFSANSIKLGDCICLKDQNHLRVSSANISKTNNNSQIMTVCNGLIYAHDHHIHHSAANISILCGRQTHWYWRRSSFRPVDFPRRNIIGGGYFQEAAVAAAAAVIYEILSIRLVFDCAKTTKIETNWKNKYGYPLPKHSH